MEHFLGNAHHHQICIHMHYVCMHLAVQCCNKLQAHISVSPKLDKKEGGKLKTTVTSKNLMHFYDHIKGKLARIGGGSRKH